jgi:hypothetical protein
MTGRTADSTTITTTINQHFSKQPVAEILQPVFFMGQRAPMCRLEVRNGFRDSDGKSLNKSAIDFMGPH